MSFADLGLKLSLPYNFTPNYVDEVLVPLKGEVEDVYLPVFWTVATSARWWNGPTRYHDYRAVVDKLQAGARPLGIRLAFVANTEPSALQVSSLIDEAIRLHHDYEGATIVLASLEAATKIRQAAPDAEVQPSTSVINTCLKAWYWKKAVNPRVITIDRALNRRPEILRALKAMGFRIKFVAQDNCITSCPEELRHVRDLELIDQMISLTGQPIGPMANFPAIVHCRPFANSLRNDPATAWVMAPKEILPGHLPRLKGLVDILKIEGRTNQNKVLLRRVEYFREAKSLRSDNPPYYEEPPEAWDKLATCDRTCGLCEWCARHIRTVPPPEQLAEPLTPLGVVLDDPDSPAKESPKVEACFRLRAADGSPELILRLAPRSNEPAFVRTNHFSLSYNGSSLGERGEQKIRELAAAVEERETNATASTWEEWRPIFDDEAQRLGLEPV